MQIGAARRWGFGKGHRGTVSKFIQGFEVHWEISHKISNWAPKVIMYWYVLLEYVYWGSSVEILFIWFLHGMLRTRSNIFGYCWDTKKTGCWMWTQCLYRMYVYSFFGVDCMIVLDPSIIRENMMYWGEYDVFSIHQSSPIVDYMIHLDPTIGRGQKKILRLLLGTVWGARCESSSAVAAASQRPSGVTETSVDGLL